MDLFFLPFPLNNEKGARKNALEMTVESELRKKKELDVKEESMNTSSDVNKNPSEMTHDSASDIEDNYDTDVIYTVPVHHCIMMCG